MAQSDPESICLLTLIENKTLQLVDSFLKQDYKYRIYQIEDNSVLTAVFFQSNKQVTLTCLTQMQKELTKYVSKKFKDKTVGTARLGFTTEKELCNIFKKVFGSSLFNSTGADNDSQ